MLILGVSGRKQSGKTTFGNFVMSLYLAKMNYCEKILMDEDGQLIISDLLGDTRYEGVFNIYDTITKFNDPRIVHAIEKLQSKIKIYNFADILKVDICMNMLGLTYQQCYGDDDMKNSLTELRWEDIPGVLTPDEFNNFTSGIREPLNSDTLRDTRENMRDVGVTWPFLLDSAGPRNGLYRSAIDDYGIIVHNPGFMTAREVMQFVGTDIFRRMDTNVWVRSTINKILREKPELAIITDCRFPNEVDSIKQIDGKVIRLTRSPFESDHISETILDKENYDWSNFDYVIDNQNVSLYEQFQQIKTIIEEILPL